MSDFHGDTWGLDEPSGNAPSGVSSTQSDEVPAFRVPARAADPEDGLRVDETRAAAESGPGLSSWRPKRPPIFIRPSPRSVAPDRGFELLQSWEGTVERIEGETFTAVLDDLIDGKRPRLVVELPLEELSEQDRRIIDIGSVFYWSIGYESALPGGRGQKRRLSLIRLRRLPPAPVDEAVVKARVGALERLFAESDDDLASV
ncbi:MAG: hypothetical protein JNJ59_00425 [Deltaproteobacteria bacterium]|nr:hypothetical protein [Deltaproteobacteria bacterium]